MNILYRGNFRPEHSTESHIAKTLEALGHTVIRNQEFDGIHGIKWADTHPQDADVFLWTTTWREDMEGARRFLDELEIPSVSFHLDLFFGLEREVFIDIDPFFRTDLVFTADGGHDEEWKRKGINHHVSFPGVFHEETRPGRPHPSFVCDIAFVGSVANYHAQWPHRRELVDFLSRTYGKRFRHYGEAGTARFRGARLNRLYASVKVIVGDSLMLGPRFVSDRVFETLGRGGFLVHPYVQGIGLEFGRHLEGWPLGDFEALKERIDYYLEHDEEREQIRLAGHEEVKANHTYLRRMEAMLKRITMFDPRLLGWPGQVRLGSADAAVIHEIWNEDVYRASEHIRPREIVVDLGANMGAFTIWAASKGAVVVAVEPWKPNLEQLTRNLGISGYEAQIVPYAAHPREVQMVAASGEYATASMHDSGNAIVAGGGKPVPSMTLDRILKPYDEIAVLKCDIEGSEYEVFAAASHEAISKCRYIAIEFHNGPTLRGRPLYEGEIGALIEKLAETHTITTLGRPSQGGYIYALRF